MNRIAVALLGLILASVPIAVHAVTGTLTYKVTSSTVPPLAAKAGFSTEMFNIDFTTSGGAWSNVNTFLSNCGAAHSTPSMPSTWTITLLRYGDDQPLPCGNAAIKADPDTGDSQVFYWKWTVAQWSASVAAAPGNNNYTQAYLAFPAYGGNTGNTSAWLPPQHYLRIVYRTTSDSWNQPGGGSVAYFAPLWATTSGNGVTAWLDRNYTEAIAGPTTQPMWNLSLGPSPTGCCSTPDSFYNFTSSNRVNYDFKYHTIEGLTTSDGTSGNVWACVVLDGNPEGCVEATGQASTVTTQHNITPHQNIGSASRTPGATNDYEMYIKSIVGYGCTAWLTDPCQGTPVTSYP